MRQLWAATTAYGTSTYLYIICKAQEKHAGDGRECTAWWGKLPAVCAEGPPWPGPSRRSWVSRASFRAA